MRKNLSFRISVLPALLLASYLSVILLNGVGQALLLREPDVEIYIPLLLFRQISADHEPETIKAQAIIARSNLYRKLEEGESLFSILEETGNRMRKTEMQEILRFFFGKGRVYEKAAEETQGKVLLCEGELKLVPYHAVSAGATRDGVETLHSQEYAYLKSVDSRVDQSAPGYLTSRSISETRLPRELTVRERDSAGYVLSLTADGNTLEGEAFRRGMGLPSANFRIQRIGDQIRFLCRGKGHGLGFSQYGGNELAKTGTGCEEILAAYFPAMEVEQVYDRIIFEKGE